MFESEILQSLQDNSVKTLIINQRFSAHTASDCQQLADALKKNTSLETLILHRQFLGPVGIRPIAMALAVHTGLTELDLSWNQLGLEGAEILAQALSNNSRINRLNLNYNQLGVAGIKKLSVLFKTMPLISLNLGANQLGDQGVEALAEILPSMLSLCKLILSGNQIGAKGIDKIMRALKLHSLYLSLDLSVNQLNEEAAEIIATYLQEQIPITELDLNYNVLGDEGASRLAEALKSNSILNILNVSDNQISEIGAIKFAKMIENQSWLTEFSCKHSDWQPEIYELWRDILGSNRSLIRLDLCERNIVADTKSSIKDILQAHEITQQALLEACMRGDVAEVQHYLQQGVSLWNNLSSNGNGLLHLAIQEAHPELTIFLIQNFETLLRAVNKQGKSALNCLCPDLTKASIWYQKVMSSGEIMVQKAFLPITPHFMRQLDRAENFDALLKMCNILREIAYPMMQTLHLAAYYNCAEFAAYLIDTKRSEPNIPDQSGQTPLMYAKAQNHTRVRSALESRIFYLKVCEDRESRFQALLKKLVEEKEKQNEHISIDADILAISEPDHIAIATEALREHIDQLPALTHVELIAQLSQILEPPLLPMLCLAHEQDWRQTRLGRILNIALTSNSRLFKPLNKRISLIQKALTWLSIQIAENSLAKSRGKEFNSHYIEIKKHLSTIEEIYLNYRENLCQATPQIQAKLYQRPVRLKGANTGWRILLPEAVQALMLSEQAAPSDTIHGTHMMRVYQHIHWKYDPEAPGIEYTVKKLDELLFEQGIPETRLLKIEQGSEVYACLGSQTVEGVDLSFILEKHPEYLEKLDLDSFGSLVILGLLTDAGDAKPDNFIAKFILSPDGTEVFKMKLMSIDNDISFVKPIIQRQNEKREIEHFTGIRNCLYFFPQMDTVVTGSIRERLCSLLPEYTILRWLHALAQQNARYEMLLEQEVFTEEEYIKLKLPIEFSPGTAKRVYRKLKSCIEWLRENPSSTLAELFKVVEPQIYAYYANIKRNYPAPLDATLQLYTASAPSFESVEELRLERARRGAIMTSIAQFSNRSIQYSNQPIYKAMAEVIESIDFSKLTEAQQHLLIAYISDLSQLSILTIRSCTILTTALLSDLIQKLSKLKSINLIECVQLNVGALKAIEKTCPNLQINLKIKQNLLHEYTPNVPKVIPSLLELSLWSVSYYERNENLLPYRGQRTVVAQYKKWMTFFVDAPNIEERNPVFNDDNLIERYAEARNKEVVFS